MGVFVRAGCRMVRGEPVFGLLALAFGRDGTGSSSVEEILAL